MTTIGEAVALEELSGILKEEEAKEKVRQQLKKEMESIKRGECLKYTAKAGMGTIAELALRTLVAEIKGLRIICKDDCAYIYRDR